MSTYRGNRPITDFCGRPDIEVRMYMHKPWRDANGLCYATNGHIVIETEIEGAQLGTSPPNMHKLFEAAFKDQASLPWIQLPYLHPFDACSACGGAGVGGSATETDVGTCEKCEGYGEEPLRIKIDDTGYCIRYMRLLSSLPSVLIAPNGMNPMPFKFDGGRGLLMPMRAIP
jgi:hypothetical protein